MKLVTFGCSFTDYGWPTWADIMAYDLGCEYENWARSGLGNQGISKRVMSKVLTGLDKDDIVIIQWSFNAREDRFIRNQWVTGGSVFNDHGIYGKDFVQKYWDRDNDLINSVHARLSAEAILRENLKFQFAVDDNDDSDIRGHGTKSISTFFSEKIIPIPIFSGTSAPFNSMHKCDRHPDPKFWLNYLDTVIYPALGYELKQQTRDKVNEIYTELMQHVIHAYSTYRSPETVSSYMHTKSDEITKKMGFKQNKIGVPCSDLNTAILF
jgi:hypothetical protein